MIDVDAKAFVREMFEADSTIRYIAIVREDYHIVASEQREGVPSLVPDEARLNFVSIIPQIILEAVEKLVPFLGQVGGVTAHYERALIVFYRIEDLIVIISLQPNRETTFYNRITEAFRKASTKYLT